MKVNGKGVSPFTATCIIFLAWLPASIAGAMESIGVNWGTIATRQLEPKTTVRLLQDNGINKVKLFDANPDIIASLAGTGIEVMIAVPNGDLEGICDYAKAKAWVKDNVVKYNVKDKAGTKITLVGLGNEPFLTFFKDQFTNTTLPALKNIHKAIGEAGLGDTVKVTIPLNADVYASPPENPVPSAGEFRADIADLMTDISEFYNQTGSPFMVNIYPFLSYSTSPNFPIEYAFFDGNTTGVTETDGLRYTNVYDAIFDTLLAALAKAGFPDIPIVIGEIGWPTDGDVYATNDIAERFYGGLMKRMAAKQGTPRAPHAAVDMYLFGLYDEDSKSVLPGDFERHWGVFGFDGQPKFPIDLAGTGNKTMPVGAKGVEYLPKKWCVFDEGAKDTSKLADSVGYACDRADCTSINNGSSCSSLSEQGKASYAFNLYFQNQNQDGKSCDFNGLATVTTKDPSAGNCTFAVGFDTSKFAAKSHGGSSSPSGSPASGSSALSVPLFVLSVFELFMLLV